MDEALDLVYSLVEPTTRIEAYIKALNRTLTEEEQDEALAFTYALERDYKEVRKALNEIELKLIEARNKK